MDNKNPLEPHYDDVYMKETYKITNPYSQIIDDMRNIGLPAPPKRKPANYVEPMYAGTQRNAKCPCGSGAKYKKCCIHTPKESAQKTELKSIPETLTVSEAKQALRDGHRLSHKYFTDEEYIEYNGTHIVDEKGHLLDWSEFFSYRTDENFKNGWSIKDTKQNETN